MLEETKDIENIDQILKSSTSKQQQNMLEEVENDLDKENLLQVENALTKAIDLQLKL